MNQVEVKRRQMEVCSGMLGLMNILIFGNLLGDNGITYLFIALEAFWLVRTIFTGSLTEALGKMLKVRVAKGQYKNTLYIRKYVMMIEGAIGILCSILFLMCAGALARKLFQVPHSTFLMMVLAPALFLQTVSSLLIGFFRGEGNELPAVVAAPLRQVLLMGFGLLFANLLGDYGEKVSNLLGDTSFAAMYGGVGVAIAFDLAELLVLLFLILITLGNRDSLQRRGREGLKQTDSLLDTVKILYGSMWFSTLLCVLELLPLWLGTLFYRKSVASIDSFAENFGVLVGKYGVLCGIPLLAICAILLSVNAKTMSAYKREDQRGAKVSFQSGLHIAVVHGLFFTVFGAVMAEQLAGMICEKHEAVVETMLRNGSVLILLFALFFYFSRMLLRLGGKYYLLGSLGIANIVFVIVLSVSLNGEKGGILSLLYAAIVAAGSCVLILCFLCCRVLRTVPQWLQSIAIPVGAMCVTGLVCMLIRNLLAPHLGDLVTAFVGLVLSFLIYWAILLLLRSFSEQELKYLPGSKLIRAAGQTLRVFDMD